VIINIVAIAVCTGLISLLFPPQTTRLNALWLLTIPGIWMILSLSTADLLASAWGLGAILSWQKRHMGLLVTCLGAGLLTRETLLIIWLALVLTQLRRKQGTALAPLGISLLPLIGWLSYIRWRQLPGGSGSGNFGWPLVGIWEKCQALLSNGLTSSNLYEAYVWLLLVVGLGFVLWTIGRSVFYPNAMMDEVLTVGYGSWLYLGLLIVASFYILNYYLNYSRVFLDVFLFALLIPPPYAWAKHGFFVACGLASLAFLGLQS
jgi:hypothetical protein